MKIKTFYLNSTKEIIVKIVKEILVLFKVEINDADDTIFDYDELKIENIYDDVALNGVKTVLTLRKDEKLWTYTRQSFLHDDESVKAGTNRLIKLNLYHIFCEDLQAKKAPWGILHGVRPTKIVHRLMEQGLDRQGVIGRLQGDYEVQIDKANLITDIAYLQLPFLAKANDPKLISVYVGIPFCPSRCLYCSFPSSILPSSEMTRKYLQTLNYEITKIKALIEQYDFKVQSIYVGGGTPTSLNENDFDDLLSLVAKSFKGDYVEEFTVEAGRPDSLSLEKAKSMTDNIAEQAREVGLIYDFSKIKAVNTFDAHRISHYAKAQGKMSEMNERLLKAHFIEHLDISHYETLVNLAVEIGLKEEEVKEVLSSTSFSNEVVADEERAKSLDIDGVPYFVFNDQPFLFGAQPEEKILETLYSVWAEEASSSMSFPSESSATSPKGMKCENGVCSLF